MLIRPVVVLAILATLWVALTGCGGARNDNGIRVYAAVSLVDPLSEIVREFESRNPGVSVKLNVAGSQRLRSQLELGAKADVFISADIWQMNRAVSADLITGKAITFASSNLVVLASIDGDTHRVRELEDLTDPGVNVIIAHQSVPAGAYTLQLLEKLSVNASGLGGNFRGQVLSNVISEETSVRNVEQKVVLGEADAGIIYRPQAEKAVQSKPDRVTVVPVPVQFNVHTAYTIAVLRNSKRHDLAAQFVAFVLSIQGQLIMNRYGFEGP